MAIELPGQKTGRIAIVQDSPSLRYGRAGAREFNSSMVPGTSTYFSGSYDRQQQ